MNTVVQDRSAPRGFVEKTALERYVAPTKPSLVGMSRGALADALGTVGVAEKQRKMRVQQLWNWIYVRGVTRFDAMTSVSKDLRAALEARFTLERPEVVAEQVSVDGTRSNAFIFRTPDARRCASRVRSAARSPARSATPARSAWCATSPPARSSGR